MLDEHRINDLKLLYQLVSRITNGVDQLKAAYSQYIKVFMLLFCMLLFYYKILYLL